MKSRFSTEQPLPGQQLALHANAGRATARQIGCGSPERSRASGFTIVELLMVLGILVVLTSVTLPSVLRWQRGLSMEQGVSTLQIQLQETRLAAIRSGEAWNLVLPQNQRPGRRQAVRDTAAVDIRLLFHWPAGLICSEVSPTTLPAASTTESDQPTRIVCQPDGTVSDCLLKLTDSNEHQTLLRIDRLTGMASVIQPITSASQLTVHREPEKLRPGRAGNESPAHASQGMAHRLAGYQKGIHE